MTDPNSTLIAVLLDRSGSMSTIKSDMEGGFDAFIQTQRENASPSNLIRVSLSQFDTKYETVYSNVPLVEVPPLELSPRGGTALMDGIGRMTNEIGEQLSALDEDQRPAKVLIVVITDGRENSSIEFTRAAVSELIARQEREWNWTYVFLGANMDAVAEGTSIGFGSNLAPGSAHTHSLTYSATRSGTRGAFNALSDATFDYLKADAAAAPVAFAFTDEHREQAAKND